MSPTPGRPLRDVFGASLVELAGRDKRIVVLDADLANSTKADVVEQAQPDQFFEMGIAEQNMLGVAAGMATVGFVPFISTFACFAVARALDSIRVLIAQPRLNVKIIGSYSGLLAGSTGKTHLIFNDLAIMRTMPNMVVVAPADDREAQGAMEAIAAYVGPVYMRMTRDSSPAIFDRSHRFELGKAVMAREGSDVTIISTGVQTARVIQAAEILSAARIEALVLHVPTLKPLDQKAILDAAMATGLVVTVEEHTEAGGLGGAVTETLCDTQPLPVCRIGLGEALGESGPNEALLEKYGLSASRVAGAVLEFLHEKRVL